MCASDYTPWWAASDNNHAWEVVLDERGQGRAGLAGKAAKVYRKTFAYQPCSLGAQLNTNEAVPRWLSGTHYIDVTSQYQATSNVRVSIEVAASDTQSHPTPQRFAYLAVRAERGDVQRGGVEFVRVVRVRGRVRSGRELGEHAHGDVRALSEIVGRRGRHYSRRRWSA